MSGVDLADPSELGPGHGEPSLRRADKDDAVGFEVWSLVCNDPVCQHEWSGRKWEAGRDAA